MKKPNMFIKIILVLGPAAALITLLPNPEASKASLLGYKTLCAFAPISTSLLLLGTYYVWSKVTGRFLVQKKCFRNKAIKN